MSRRDACLCHHLNRQIDYCSERAVVTFDYAGGIGACRKHIGTVLLWCMEPEKSLPTRQITAHPTWRWDQDQAQQLGAKTLVDPAATETSPK